MHPIIKEYLNTNTPLLDILEKNHQEGEFLESVFLEMVRPILLIKETENNIYEKIDQAIIKGHEDQNIYFLFLVRAIFFATFNKKLEIAKVIYSISVSLSIDGIHPIIQVLHLQSIGNLKFHEKNKKESIRLFQSSMKLIDEKHPRYKNMFCNYASILAEEGRLNELEDKELVIFNSTFEDRYAFEIIKAKLNNSIVTGDYKNSVGLIDEFQRVAHKLNIGEPPSLDFFNILSGDLNESHYKSEDTKLLVQTLHYLSIGKIEEAIKYNNLFVIKENQIQLGEYVSFNIELGLGKINAARKLLEEKEAIGNFHYLDDFFYARLQLMENNMDGAYHSIRRLFENVNRYGAMNRILFEMQFAKELKPTDLFILMNKLNNSEIITKPKILRSKPVNIKAKGVNLLVGSSPEINQVKDLIKKYAPLHEIILVTGETGTGKELVAKALHEESSFCNEPFLAINCGALTDTLLESELFGYEAGSFTGAVKQKKGIFEAAGKGTVFLDEFGDISPKVQVSLLRLLESNEIRLIGGTGNRKVECRIVVATNVELNLVVKEKKFREDLYFRLTRFEINIPPLRKRIGDLQELVNYFLHGSVGLSGKQKIISLEVLRSFSAYQWPGNIRELKNCIDRLKILNPEKEELNIEDLIFIQFQGPISLPKSLEKLNLENSPSLGPVELGEVHQSNDDDYLRIINQKGFKSEKRLLFLKKLFQKYKRLSLGQMTEITKVNPVTTNQDLQKLCEEGFIVKKTPTKSYRSNFYEII